MSPLNDQFESYYNTIYGKRWTGLRESLIKESKPIPYSDGLVTPYMLDHASVLAALSLRVPDEGQILDACAAPGGKSLVIASIMCPQSTLLSNELSGERRRRLVKVLDEHLPPEKRERVTVSGFDAAAAGGKKSEHTRFTAILLDAPCSSERHVINNEKALAEWTPARPRFLAKRQWALLSSAFLLLQPGASLVYATCALSPEENDGVASRLVEKYRGTVLLDHPDFSEGEETKYGRIILPDLCGGMGPMYVARFKKAILTP
ncbi:16S rRNA methyltransferase [Treponema primitia]|uniref:16S rRNA methyltransferase n=1 Tax=Treponema primitia TaxID=88058 RepID=UPI00025558E8|nr:16S rRNA methyltransferase [Treponema primitia]